MIKDSQGLLEENREAIAKLDFHSLRAERREHVRFGFLP